MRCVWALLLLLLGTEAIKVDEFTKPLAQAQALVQQTQTQAQTQAQVSPTLSRLFAASQQSPTLQMLMIWLSQKPSLCELLLRSTASVKLLQMIEQLDAVEQSNAQQSNAQQNNTQQSNAQQSNAQPSQVNMPMAKLLLDPLVMARRAEWEQVINRTILREEGLVNALELQSEQSTATAMATNNFTMTCVEQWLAGQYGDSWPSNFSVLSWVMIAIAALIVLTFVASLAEIFLRTGGVSSLLKGDGMFVFISITFFALALMAEMIVGDRLITNLGNTYTSIRKSLQGPKATQLASGLTALAMLQHTEQGAQTLLQLSEMQYLTTDPPLLCAAAYQSGNVTFNRYPTGSLMYTYNLRHIANVQTSESPELDYAKSLIQSNPYPPPAGGVTTQQAKMFQAVSNECEQFQGNVADCCNDSLSTVPQADRCPGKALQQYSTDYCTCVEGLCSLGLAVDTSHVIACVLRVREWTLQWLAATV